jgi:flagellar basal-body rod protein FlgG
MVQTENALDVAIDGPGYFQILRPDATIGYTRDGSFKLSADGSLVTSNGFQLQPTVAIPADAQSITIGLDGTVSVMRFGQPQPTIVGNVQLATFVNPAGLQATGENMYIETAASGAAQLLTPAQLGAGKLVQGALEASNVNVVEEMVNMIETQRAYEVNSKAISAADQMLKFVNNNL